MNLYQAFHAAFPTDRGKPFLHLEDGRVVSYGTMEDLSGRIARVLMDLGVQPGDRVAVQVDKSAEAVALYLACLRAGAVYLPLNTAYTPAEVQYFLSDADPAVLVCDPARANGLAQGRRVLTLDGDGQGSLSQAAATVAPVHEVAVPARPEDLAAILYTSGTTGRAKGAMISHGNLLANGRTLHRLWGFGPHDRLIHALPIYHTHGLFVALNTTLLNGTDIVFLRKFEASTVLTALAHGTVLMGVPTFYTRLLAEPGLTAQACAAMRLFISGSAPLLEETFTAFRDRTGHTILERYGMTETNMITSNPLMGERRLGAVGLALPDVEIRIADGDGAALPLQDTGMVEVRGPNVFQGYWNMPEKTREEFRSDGFFITGDLGVLSADGYLTLVGRAKDLIISGGFNVYPKEVESVIDAVPGVEESAVIGLPHADFGEGVAAVVVRVPGGMVSEDDILSVLMDQIAAYKRPKRIFFVDALPRNAMGKVQKTILRDRYADSFT